MVVALSEEVWFRTYESTLSSMDLTSRFLRYVDNRLCLVDPSWMFEPAFGNFLHPDFYGSPIILETEPDQEFLGFVLEFDPFALRYSPPRDLNQVMAPFSASPLHVQLSGFVSRVFLVATCAHPSYEQFRGFAALHRLCSQAGFQDEDLVAAARPTRAADTCTFDHCGEKFAFASRTPFTMVPSSLFATPFPILISLHTCSVLSSFRPLILIQGLQLRFCVSSRSLLAPVWPPMGSESSTPFLRMQLDDRTFRLFPHDVHHAYLLLHRAFLQLPPTIFPTLEPMPLPCHMMISTNHHPLNLIRHLLLPSPKSKSHRTKKKRTTKCLCSPRTNSSHILLLRPSSPVQFVMYLDRMPPTSTMPFKSPIWSPHEPSRRHRRTTKPRKDKEPAERRPSR